MPKFLDNNILRLANGLEVNLIEGGEKELCRLDLVFDAGFKFQNKPLQASMCNAMLFQGTNRMKGTEINEYIDFCPYFLEDFTGNIFTAFSSFQNFSS